MKEMIRLIPLIELTLNEDEKLIYTVMRIEDIQDKAKERPISTGLPPVKTNRNKGLNRSNSTLNILNMSDRYYNFFNNKNKINNSYNIYNNNNYNNLNYSLFTYNEKNILSKIIPSEYINNLENKFDNLFSIKDEINIHLNEDKKEYNNIINNNHNNIKDIENQNKNFMFRNKILENKIKENNYKIKELKKNISAFQKQIKNNIIKEKQLEENNIKIANKINYIKDIYNFIKINKINNSKNISKNENK